MAPTPSIKIIKQFSYRGEVRQWSNRYHVTGPDWTGSTQFNTCADNIVGDEKHSLLPAVTIVEAVGYDAGSDVPVFSKAYSVAGLYSVTGTERQAPGDCAALVRYSTTQRTSKNHPIYLFNYYHAPLVDLSLSADHLSTAYIAQIASYATNWIAGYSDGTNTRKRCGPNGAVAQGQFVESFVTHRDLPR